MNSESSGFPRVAVVIPAAGRGERFGSPKQFQTHLGWSLLRWALEPFLGLGDSLVAMAVALPPGETARGLEDLAGHPRLHTCTGGASRQESVRLGLKLIAGELRPDDVVLVHDAARPLLSGVDLRRIAELIARTGAGALLAVPVRDTLKRAGGNGLVEETVPRSGLYQAQTPQGAPAHLLIEAHDRALRAGLHATDDAAVLEAAGIPVHIVEGDPLNFKITGETDWKLFTALARRLSGRDNPSTPSPRLDSGGSPPNSPSPPGRGGPG